MMRLERVNFIDSTLDDKSRLSESLRLRLRTKADMVLVSFCSGVVCQLSRSCLR